MTLYCATTNAGKLREFRLAAAASNGLFEVEVVPELNRIAPCEETGATFRENAILKALHFSPHAPGYLFVDDSGLAVEALGGAPGARSARYAGPDASDDANNALLLERMRGVADRRARFVCVIALARHGQIVETFEDAVEGELLDGPRGAGGFGYDPLFFYAPFACTLAEVHADRKMEVSHRGKALRAMFTWLTAGSNTGSRAQEN